MKFLTTYQDLNNRLIELDNIKANSNTLYLMLSGRIEQFHMQNGYDIKMLREKMRELFEKHVEKNAPEEQSTKGCLSFKRLLAKYMESRKNKFNLCLLIPIMLLNTKSNMIS